MHNWKIVLKNDDKRLTETSCKTNLLVCRGEDLEDHEKSNHKFMANFENSFQRHMQKKKLLDQNKYDVETESLMILVYLWIGINHQKSNKDDVG